MPEKFSFTKENSYKFIDKLLLRYWGENLSQDFWDIAWESRCEWESIGEGYRRECCVPAAEGNQLVELYCNVYGQVLNNDPLKYHSLIANELGHFTHLVNVLNEDLVQVLTEQKIGPKGQKKKLSRWMVEKLIERGIEKNIASDFVAELQDGIKRSNGARIVISANPLDVLLSSMYTDGWQSCHDWSNKSVKEGSGAHASGNWQYVFDPRVLIAYSYEKYENYSDDDVLFPKKKWRQLVFVDKPDIVYFGREYPNNMPELQHSALRKMLAQILTGNTDDVKWHFRHTGSVYRETVGKVKYFYSDGITGQISISGNFKDASYIDIPPAHCPSCNNAKSITCTYNYILCNKCMDFTCYCWCCDKTLEDTSRGDDWPVIDNKKTCKDCVSEHYLYCRYGAHYIPKGQKLYKTLRERYKSCFDCANNSNDKYEVGYYCDCCDEFHSYESKHCPHKSLLIKEVA